MLPERFLGRFSRRLEQSQIERDTIDKAPGYNRKRMLNSTGKCYLLQPDRSSGNVVTESGVYPASMLVGGVRETATDEQVAPGRSSAAYRWQ